MNRAESETMQDLGESYNVNGKSFQWNHYASNKMIFTARVSVPLAVCVRGLLCAHFVFAIFPFALLLSFAFVRSFLLLALLLLSKFNIQRSIVSIQHSSKCDFIFYVTFRQLLRYNRKSKQRKQRGKWQTKKLLFCVSLSWAYFMFQWKQWERRSEENGCCTPNNIQNETMSFMIILSLFVT